LIVTIVEDKYIEGVFEQVKHLLQKPIDRGLGEYTIDQIRDLVISGRQQLWVGIDDKTGDFIVSAVTQIIPRVSGQTHMETILTGAVENTMEKWFEESAEALEEFGRLNGADHFIFYGRLGWRKMFKKRGYKEYYVAMSKDLKND
tara:strand:+ start:744 stop:1178 length:435 start_codon:yes stop_codon:yes gene_type:complete